VNWSPRPEITPPPINQAKLGSRSRAARGGEVETDMVFSLL
jgi:hypothetical protein